MSHLDDAFLRKLARGVERFRTTVFPRRRRLFEALARAQSPEALFVTCADSRIVPSLITHSGPGDLFIERNPGNLVPVYGPQAVGVSASIEYAVAVLRVRHVIVCGHTDCGAVKGILHPEKVADVPAVARWLAYGEPARRALEQRPQGASEEAQVAELTRLNVLVQLEHLRTHPAVQRALAAGALELHAWVYEIESGRVEAWEPAAGAFAAWPSAP
jgi:carbonic anhydrase